MPDFYPILVNLGLDGSEATVYLALLPLGPASALEISQISGIERTQCYRVLGRLRQKRLVTVVQDGKRTKYVCERPTKLYTLLDQEKKRLALEEAKLHASFPGLLDFYNQKGNVLGIKYYQGLPGFTQLIDELIERLEHFESPPQLDIFCLGKEENLLSHLRQYAPRYFRVRKARNIHARVLSPSGIIPIHDKTGLVEKELDDRRRLPFLSDQTFYEFLLPDLIAQLFIGEYAFLGVIIEHSAFVDKDYHLFELAWTTTT